MRFETIAARGGRDVPSASHPLTPPIYQSNVYTFETMEDVEGVWEGKAAGFVYGRYGSPNTAMLEAMMAALEGGEAAVACASGMGALTALFLALLASGDHLVAGRDLYGTTTAFLAEELRRAGVDTTFVDATEPGNVLAALTPRTRAVYVEAISNPLLKLVDLEALGAELRSRGVELIADSSFASPAVLKPLGLGATVVHHSATKFVSGHGDVTAGIAVGRRELMDRVRAAVIRLGTNLGPFDAWLASRGLRTLHVRLERQSANALVLARFLDGRPEVARVYYPGLPSHPQHGLAQRLFKNGAGAICSFDLKGGAPAVERFMAGLRLIEFAPSFGDVATTWSYPARTSHRRLSESELAALGIGPGLVRLSAGLEAVQDLIEDLTGALDCTRS
ncbi:MAG: aminotransferase class I/II-fold pyridoxal phosphate-dependent enzyme [Candidatus Rokubacteria bacterium]|nr:aminotransferase class I/II-fold pyridoxal phosphate-dependent enzyme [Candidatus Rokubacteria bacterium]